MTGRVQFYLGLYPSEKKYYYQLRRRIQILLVHVSPWYINDLHPSSVNYYTDIDRDGHEISCFGGLPRVIFSQGKILSWGKIQLSWHHRHVISHPSQSISTCIILDGQNEWFHKNLMCSTTMFGNKTRSLRTKQTECKLDSFARVLHVLLTTVYSACGAFLSGSVS